ncbi:beta-ketoacyl synthase chain length factor [Fulvivirga maritima]|uniref:beta-ketoacyl synthase chain length factor n=1 Tax=Fulvivirga maritima TaxID=2904247 RepID=UPI001F45CC50|nr:beta-ketoacyl synthase chain length factor [Fulvivirga maritima]UII27327.1 beta-ketoacyl synthase chain length factor [Fulvivirga maritima]
MFIRDMSCISPQETYYGALFTEGVKFYNDPQLLANEPSYKGIIPMGLLRRMSKLVRMSVATGMPLMEQNNDVDAVIFASSNGSVDHSLRFLNQIIDYNEGTLTPTDFVQSTPNCVAGMLALMGKKRGYNTTHVNQGLCFESSVLDAKMLLEEGNCKALLIGGGEEQSSSNYNIESQRNLFKKEEISTEHLLKSGTQGTLPGEGVTMFVAEANRSDRSIAEVVDVDSIQHVDEVMVEDKIKQFLSRNHLDVNDLDALVLGRNGDVVADRFYDHVEKHLFKEQNLYVYKHLSGDYYSVPAFSLWIAAMLITGSALPDICLWKNAGKKEFKHILLYNNCEGKQHGFILLKK